MRYLTLHEVLEAHERILRQSGGEPSLLNLGALWNRHLPNRA
jgi:hypothetical protein